ncbi:hypothetical protein [Paraburkholderia sediminicola]|uniref:hypothetical protein n=1 Tax=Paraburkholderia sediminicola TaxID=458836 RepID=UPI0038B807C7
MRQALAPVVREALAPLYASQRERRDGHAGGAAPDRGDENAMAQKPLLQAALEDAHARIRRLEQDNAQLHRELGEAHAARDLAGEHANRLLGELHPVDPPDREPLSAWYAGAVRRPSGWRAGSCRPPHRLRHGRFAITPVIGCGDFAAWRLAVVAR